MKNRLQVNSRELMKESALWNKQNQELLPDGRGEIRCAGEGCHIDLVWHYHGKKQISAFVQKEWQ